MTFYKNIEKTTKLNKLYRNVAWTGKHVQFVYMSIKPLDNIHMEVHNHIDQFIRIESGKGVAIINKKKYKLYDGIGFIIPAGSKHEIINTSKKEDLKLYSTYSPPEHPKGLKQKDNPDKVKKSSKKESKKNSKKISKKN
jgi:mannose-6-phosphate isomerase-like protein (cupin superfamily)